MSRARDLASSKANNFQTVTQEYSSQFNNSSIQVYQVFGSLNITARGTGSKFLLTSSVNAYVPSGGRGNTGYSVTQAGITTRLLGTDGGANGDSWRAFGNNTGNTGWSHQSSRSFLWTPSTAVSSGTTLTFNLLVASFDVAVNWNYQGGYNDRAHFIVTEIPGY
jgi:hypothetical protein